MRKFFDFQNNNWLIHIFALGILLTNVWAEFFALDIPFYGDPFHHGELVASLPSVLAGNIKFFTIHGAMDWLPAWFSQQMFGAERHFLPTMLIHTSLYALASLFLYCVIASLIGRDGKHREIILMVTAVLTVYLASIRDVFLILTIWLYFLCEKSSSHRSRNVLEITLGVSLAVNLFWSFDRGIAGMVGIGLACLILALSEKRYLLSIGSFVASLFAMTWIDALSFSNYVDNCVFLLATSSQWSYGYSKFVPIFWTVVVAVPNGLAIYHLGKQLHQVIRTSWKATASLLLLLVLDGLMFKIATNRADAPHVVMALWMPVLAFLYLRGEYAGKLSMFANATMIISIIWLALRWGNYWFLFGAIVPVIYATETRYPGIIGYLASRRVVIVFFAIPFLFANLIRISSNYSQDGYLWMSQLSALPANRSLVDESIRWVSSEIVRVGSHCVFDLSNNGVINGVTGLPACTTYTYPVYATQRYEADMLQQLQQRNPPIVVFSSTHSAFSIDRRSMHDRFPELKDYLVKAYPFEKCHFGYCLRYVSQPG